ncbi:unnamed protein product (macronuclear) [Paramecium tetraurelia]|uniref:TOG domain-containing protein n=1 Tax=Paramecium tetraurelia TaxID=5888 RepID=A0CDY4_PARTE|nr:uncharacterized protein GSPATT00007213001 [Paramecium tetraurelia]CAK69001.1 unnamed protein product [Paramecium tetraurelia]|eukprot:XP_001436398.1 hypothetical protein (macronuclear) [Paramecium tetraurelia strain d4-2]
MDPQTIQVIGFNELPQIDPNQLTQLAAETQQLFAYGTKAWLQLFQAITNLRCINKYVPQYVNQLFEMFGQQVMIAIDDSKPKIQRNVVTFVNEVFSLGRSVQICPQIFQVFVPKLILKSQNSEHKQIKEECLVAVSNYILNCSQYEAGLFAVIQLTGQKKSTVPLQKFCLQVMAKQIQTIGSFLQSFSVNTLTLLLQALSSFLNSQGGEIQTYAFQICMYLHQLVGDQNFKNWMSVSLDPQSTQVMVNKIQEVLKKKSKAKQHTTMTDMKQRMTFGVYENQEQVENQNHFQEFVKDKQKANNFLDLNQVQPLQPSVYYNENLNYQQQQPQQLVQNLSQQQFIQYQ